MEKILDIVALGEILIDFTPYGNSDRGNTLFEQNPGGAPANLLVAATRFGANTSFIGKVGQDQFGHHLKEVLEDTNIDTSGLVFTKDANTTLVFVHLDDEGERTFSFYRKPGADFLLEVGDLNKGLLSSTKVFHFGSLSLTNEPARSASLQAVQYAKDSGAIISYDPNWRPGLWDSKEDAIGWMRTGARYADIIKVSDEELSLITGENDIKSACELLKDMGPQIILVTLGEEGCYYSVGKDQAIVPSYKVAVVDSTGAGDSFFGSFLYQVIETGKELKDISKDEIETFIAISNATAALCIQKKGAIPAIPLRKDVQGFMAKL